MMQQSEQMKSLYRPGPHILQHSPSIAYWVSGSQWGWAAVSTCRITKDTHEYEAAQSGGGVISTDGCSVVTVHFLRPDCKGRDGKSQTFNKLLTLKLNARQVHFVVSLTFLLLIWPFWVLGTRQVQPFKATCSCEWKTKVKVNSESCVIWALNAPFWTERRIKLHFWVKHDWNKLSLNYSSRLHN